jgi:hypothetical protein
MASISPICKKCKNFISALKSHTYIDFMIKKIIKIQDIKISHLGTFKQYGSGYYGFLIGFSSFILYSVQ